jgi:hypothetical protein
MTNARPFMYQLAEFPIFSIVRKYAVMGIAQGGPVGCGEVRLWIEVEENCRFSLTCHGSGQIEHCRRFADTAFLVEDCDSHTLRSVFMPYTGLNF